MSERSRAKRRRIEQLIAIFFFSLPINFKLIYMSRTEIGSRFNIRCMCDEKMCVLAIWELKLNEPEKAFHFHYRQVGISNSARRTVKEVYQQRLGAYAIEIIISLHCELPNVDHRPSTRARAPTNIWLMNALPLSHANKMFYYSVFLSSEFIEKRRSCDFSIRVRFRLAYAASAHRKTQFVHQSQSDFFIADTLMVNGSQKSAKLPLTSGRAGDRYNSMTNYRTLRMNSWNDELI